VRREWIAGTASPGKKSPWANASGDAFFSDCLRGRKKRKSPLIVVRRPKLNEVSASGHGFPRSRGRPCRDRMPSMATTLDLPSVPPSIRPPIGAPRAARPGTGPGLVGQLRRPRRRWPDADRVADGPPIPWCARPRSLPRTRRRMPLASDRVRGTTAEASRASGSARPPAGLKSRHADRLEKAPDRLDEPVGGQRHGEALHGAVWARPRTHEAITRTKAHH